MSIGLPKIEIVFKQLAVSAVQRSERGIVALIVKDDTDDSFNVVEYKSVTEIETEKFTSANAAYIADVLEGGASKVIVARIAAADGTLAQAIAAIGSKKYNWIGYAEGLTADQTALVTYAKEQEAANKKHFKAMVFNATAPDTMTVVNFGNAKVTKADGTEVTGEKYIARLMGTFAGLPLTQSGTYKIMSDLKYVEEPADVEEAINAGKLVLFNDEETVRIARAVNSLTTLGTDKTEDMQKIIIVETMQLIQEDILKTFKDDYLGKYKNKYDNQVLFITAVNAYFEALEDEDVLDPEFDNVAFVDVEAQRAAWLAVGKTEAAEWDDAKVRINTFRSNVYLSGSIKILDAIEDFKFNITMQ